MYGKMAGGPITMYGWLKDGWLSNGNVCTRQLGTKHCTYDKSFCLRNVVPAKNAKKIIDRPYSTGDTGIL